MTNYRAYLLGPVLALALLPSSFVAAALPLLRVEWQASAVELGWVFAAYQVGYVISVLFILPLTDRVQIGHVIAACALATAVSFILFPFLARGVWSASLLRFLAGLGLAGIYMPGTRVVAALAQPERRGSAVGIYVSSFYLGGAASLWASGVLLAQMDWRQAALLLGSISLVALPLAVLSTRGISTTSAGRRSLDLRVLREGPVTRTILAYTGHSWELYISRGWLATFIAGVLMAQGMDTIAATASGGQWAALVSAFGMPGVFLGGWLSDRMGRARAALIIAVASGIGSLIFGFLGESPLFLLIGFGCAYITLVSADSAIYSTAVTEFAPSDRIGSAQALQAFCGFSATIAAPVVAGRMLDLGMGWGAIFAVGGIIGIGLALPLIALTREAFQRKVA